MVNVPPQAAEEEDSQNANDDSSSASGATSGPDFNYILNMSLWSLTKEKVEELIKHRDSKVGTPWKACSEITPSLLMCLLGMFSLQWHLLQL